MSKTRHHSRTFFFQFFSILLLVSSPLYIYSDGKTGKSNLLIIRTQSPAIEDAVKGITEECHEDFSIQQMSIGNATVKKDIALQISISKPDIVVLMDNRAITLYKEYQKTLPDSSARIPSVALMGILIQQSINDLQNAAGISYEVPIVTSVTSLRILLGRPIARVGVIYRERMSDFVNDNVAYCKKEKIEIVPFPLPNISPDFAGPLAQGLDDLIRIKKVDALWIPNDNALLKPTLITSVWGPALAHCRKPVIVGVEVLVNPAINIGTFAVLPDHRALGHQAAELIFTAKENAWRFPGLTVEPPVSVYKIINGRQAREYFNLGKKALENIDKVAQ